MAAELQKLPFPPCAPLAGHEPGSFAEKTIRDRLPAILDTVVADITRLAATPAMQAHAADCEAAKAAVLALRGDMVANAGLLPLAVPEASTHPQLMTQIVAWTNATLEAWKPHASAGTWFDLPWLVIECYLYVRLAVIMQTPVR